MVCSEKTKTAHSKCKGAGGCTIHTNLKSLQILREAAQYLAGQCDYAKAKDYVGFNKPDASFGHYVAYIPVEMWTPQITYAAYEMLKKYRNQLAAGGIDIGSVEPPVQVEIDGERANLVSGMVSRKGNCFKLEFRYDYTTKEIVKAHNARFGKDQHGVYWLVPITPENAEWLKEFSEQMGWFIVDDSREYLDNPQKANLLAKEEADKETKKESDNPRKIAVVGELFVVSFKYDPTLVAEVKSLPRKTIRYSGETKCWYVQINRETVEWAKKMVAQYGFQVLGDLSHAEEIASNQPEPKNEKQIGMDGDKITVTFPYNPPLFKQLVSMEHGRIWNKANKRFEIVLTSENAALLLELAEKEGFDLPDDVRAKLEEIEKIEQQNLEQSRALDGETFHIPGLKKELRKFQFPTVDYAARAKRILIADDMGLGKTVEALATVQYLNAYPLVVVCPASVKYNWEREAENWIEGKRISIIDKDKVSFDADIVILNYDILFKHKDALKALNPQAIIFDESHYLMNQKAQRSKAAKELAENVPVRLLLSGTPMINRPIELASQLDIMGRLDEFGGFFNFAKRYCDAKQVQINRYKKVWDFTGASNLEELNEKLRARCFIRRLKKDAMKDLPPKLREIVHFRIANEKEYRSAERDFHSMLRKLAMEDKEFLASIAHLPEEEQERLKTERADSAVYKARRAETLVKIEKLKQLAAKGKMEAVKEWTENFIQSGEKLVLFATHQATIDELSKQFPNAPVITGQVSGQKRQAAVDRFQNDPNCPVIILNTRAGGFGLTLTAASNVAFVELDWSSTVHSQAEDRVYRIGQTECVNAYYLLDDRTIEGDIWKLIETKHSTVETATNGDSTVSYVEDEQPEGDLLDNLLNNLTQKWVN